MFPASFSLSFTLLFQVVVMVGRCPSWRVALFFRYRKRFFFFRQAYIVHSNLAKQKESGTRYSTMFGSRRAQCTLLQFGESKHTEYRASHGVQHTRYCHNVSSPLLPHGSTQYRQQHTMASISCILIMPDSHQVPTKKQSLRGYFLAVTSLRYQPIPPVEIFGIFLTLEEQYNNICTGYAREQLINPERSPLYSSTKTPFSSFTVFFPTIPILELLLRHSD